MGVGGGGGGGGATTGAANTIVGANAGTLNMTTGYNTIIGNEAGTTLTGVAQQNVCVGYDSEAGTTGNYNMSFGRGIAGTTGNGNIKIGHNTGTVHKTGSYSILLGHEIDSSSTSVSYEFLMGANSRLLMNGDYSTAGSAKLIINPGATVVAATSTLQVRGQGTTSSTSSFVVEDSGGTDHFEIKDDGTVFMYNLPTSDPSVAGQLWNDSGALKVSAG